LGTNFFAEACVIKELAKGIAMRLVIRGVLAVLGVAVMLGWWTLTDRSHKSKNAVSSSKIPSKILGGGGPKVTIDVDITGPAELSIETYLPRKPGQNLDDQSRESDIEKLDAGHHTWVVELAPTAAGDFQLEAVNPPVGTRLGWSITVDGKKLADESESLTEPLKSGEAFFLQANLDKEEEEQSPSSDSHQ
jgi:hypothetical protein